jgi:hypothetical protein
MWDTLLQEQMGGKDLILTDPHEAYGSLLAAID